MTEPEESSHTCMIQVRPISKSKKHTDTKQSNKRNNQDSKDKRQDYNMK